jgi:hypothetical protein
MIGAVRAVPGVPRDAVTPMIEHAQRGRLSMHDRALVHIAAAQAATNSVAAVQ